MKKNCSQNMKNITLTRNKYIQQRISVTQKVTPKKKMVKKMVYCENCTWFAIHFLSDANNSTLKRGMKKMIELKKGNKAPYKGVLLGMKEYQNYVLLKDMLPDMMKTVQSLKEE